MRNVVYTIVEDAIENHELDCKCYICTAYVNAKNGSEGHAAACSAVSDRLYGTLGEDIPNDQS